MNGAQQAAVLITVTAAWFTDKITRAALTYRTTKRRELAKQVKT